MDKSCVPVAKPALSVKKKYSHSTHIVDKVLTAFGFAVIISTVGSYKVWAHFINNVVTILEDYF